MAFVGFTGWFIGFHDLVDWLDDSTTDMQDLPSACCCCFDRHYGSVHKNQWAAADCRSDCYLAPKPVVFFIGMYWWIMALASVEPWQEALFPGWPFEEYKFLQCWDGVSGQRDVIVTRWLSAPAQNIMYRCRRMP